MSKDGMGFQVSFWAHFWGDEAENTQWGGSNFDLWGELT